MNELDFVVKIGKQGDFVNREKSIVRAVERPLHVSSDGLECGSES